MLGWDNLKTGQVFHTAQVTISAEDIIEYATEFDPQPYHLDPEFAETSIFGGHCASGWHICALTMRLLADTQELNHLQLANASSVDTLRWFKPVFANNVLHASVQLSDFRSVSNSDHQGTADLLVKVMNQDDQQVMELSITCATTGLRSGVVGHE